MPNRFKHLSVFSLLLAAGLLMACSQQRKAAIGTWNPKAAADYLDAREATWMGWAGSARDHDTFCVSCHTVMPYALSRPVLRSALAERGESTDEREILDNVAKRVRLWKVIGPYYSDGAYYGAKTSESRGTEAVLNALILANNDARSGKISDVTRSAFANMWSSQLTDGDAKGAWPWLSFDMEPWEANDSQYYGAAVAALAVGIAPQNYRSSPEIQGELELLSNYLNSKYRSQSAINQVVLLWASSRLQGLIDSQRQESIIQEIVRAQRSDGGWQLSYLAWPSGWSTGSIIGRRLRSDWTRQDSKSDGYATGLITFVLQETGMSVQDPTVQHGLAWLASNQNATDGSWPSVSLTRRRSSSSNVGQFMRDAATAYAVLALTKNTSLQSRIKLCSTVIERPLCQ